MPKNEARIFLSPDVYETGEEAACTTECESPFFWIVLHFSFTHKVGKIKISLVRRRSPPPSSFCPFARNQLLTHISPKSNLNLAPQEFELRRIRVHHDLDFQISFESSGTTFHHIKVATICAYFIGPQF